MKKWIKKFYAVITDDFIGIFTEWDDVKKMITGRKNKQKKFATYYEAMNFIKANLSYEELIEYGILSKKIRWDEKIYKKQNKPILWQQT